MQSKEMIDIYSTREPQLAFHQRISFCLDIHNMSVKVSARLQAPAGGNTALHTWVPRRRLVWFGAQFPARLGKVTVRTGGLRGQRTWLMGL